jgi:hypothetical protein
LGDRDEEDFGARSVRAKKFVKPPSQWKKLDTVVCACHPSNTEKHKIRGLQSRLIWAKNETLSPK